MITHGRFSKDVGGNINIMVQTDKIIPEKKLKKSNKKKQNVHIKSEIESHASEKFAKIMEMDKILPSDVMDSLSLEANRKMVFKSGEGAGQSGSFFFFSYDNKFIIKTLRGIEKDIMLDMADDYIDHI